MPHKTLSTEEFIKRSKQIHGEKYNYSKTILLNTKIKVIITCHIHGDFEVMPFNHLLNKQGCKKCYFKSRMLSMKNIIRRFSEKHNNFYTYNLNNNVKVTDKIEIVCPIHGKFFQLLSNHLNGLGCNKCGIDRRSKSRKLTNEKFIKKSLKVHGCMYDYSLVDYKSSNNKIKIICKIHGIFLQNPSSHLVGAGCPHCSYVGNISKK